MSVAITDLGNEVQFAFTGTISSKEITFNKATMRLKATGDLVVVTNSDSFNQSRDNKVLELKYTDVTSPVYASNAALFAGLKTMVDDNAPPAHDEALGADKVIVLNGPDDKWTSTEHLINLSALAAGDYYYIIPMEGYRHLHLHWKLYTNNAGDTVSMDMYETGNPDADDTDTTDWIDKTTEFLTATKTATGVANTEEESEQINDRNPLKYMLHINVTGTATTGAADVYIKKAY